MLIFWGVVVGLVILTLLVVVHESGHAMAALRNGVKVEEFGVGFPPKVWARKLKNGILFSINALPIGGFVKLKGEYDSDDQEGDYGAATFWQKTKILLAGVLMNWVVAIILLSGLAFTGLPKVMDGQFYIPSDTTIVYKPITVANVVNGYPADMAGIKSGDQVVSLNNHKVTTVDQLLILIKQNQGKKVDLSYTHNGTMISTSIKLMDENSSKGLLGASLGQTELLKASWSAPIVGIVTTAQFTQATFQGLGTVFCNLINGIVGQFSLNQNDRAQAKTSLGAVSNSVSGPVGILGVIFPAAEKAGVTQLVFLTAIISISLAVMNVLPIPALDGGRWLIMSVFKLFNRKLTKELEGKIQTIGFLIIMVLVILVTVADVGKII